jgi:hypothetical protein
VDPLLEAGQQDRAQHLPVHLPSGIRGRLERQLDRVPQPAVGEPERAPGITAGSDGQLVQLDRKAVAQGAQPVGVDRDPVPLPPHERARLPFVHLDIDPRPRQPLRQAQPGQPRAGDRDRGSVR